MNAYRRGRKALASVLVLLSKEGLRLPREYRALRPGSNEAKASYHRTQSQSSSASVLRWYRASARSFFVIGLLVLAAACSSGDVASTAPSTREITKAPIDRADLKPVALPDLSGAADSVKTQLTAEHSSLTKATQNPNATPSELANAYGQFGKLLMAAEFRAEADACFLNAQALAPTDMRWPYYRGHLHKSKGETREAVAAFEEALARQPNDIATLVWLGVGYLDQGRAEAAEPLFAKALSMQPRLVAALYGVGRAAVATRDYARAVKSLEDALSLDPQALLIHYPLAMAYRGLGDLEKAERHLQQRGDSEIRPPDPLIQELDVLLESAVAYEVRAARALEEAQWSAAAEYSRKGLELAPKEPSLRHKLGTALAMTGDLDGAMQQFEEARRLSPKFVKAHFSAGVIMASSGHTRQAIEAFSTAVKYEPNYVEARLQLANILRRSGRFDAALAHYAQVMTTDPRVAEAPYGYAMTLVRLGRYREARDRLLEGRKAFPTQLAFGVALARLLAAAPDDSLRDGQGAMAIMQDVLKGPRTIEIGETMAMTFAELGQFSEAARWQREAITEATRAERGDLVEGMTETLKRYERATPCRTPWRADDPMEFALTR